MHTIDANGDIIIHTGDGEDIRLDPETAAFLLGESHLHNTLRTRLGPRCRICEEPGQGNGTTGRMSDHDEQAA